MDRDFYQFAEQNGTNVKELNLFKKPIAYLAPGQGVHIWLSQGFNLGKEIDGTSVTPLEFTVSSKYSFQSETYFEDLQIDITPYMNSTQDIDETVDAIDKLKQEISKLAGAIANKKSL